MCNKVAPPGRSQRSRFYFCQLLCEFYHKMLSRTTLDRVQISTVVSKMWVIECSGLAWFRSRKIALLTSLLGDTTLCYKCDEYRANRRKHGGLVGCNLRKLSSGAQLQTFPYPTVSKSFLYSSVLAKSGAQSLTFKSMKNKQTRKLDVFGEI